MKSPVLVTALVLAASLAACRGSIADSIKEMTAQISETAQNAASTVTEAAGSVKDYVLGPEQGETEYCTDKGCNIPGFNQPKGAGGVASSSTDSDEEKEDDNDDDEKEDDNDDDEKEDDNDDDEKEDDNDDDEKEDDNDDDEKEDDNDDDEKEDDNDDEEKEDDNDDDATVAVESTDDNSAPQKWTVSSTIRDAFTTVKDNIKYNVYKKTSDFADNIRSMFREEFTYFLETLWENTVGMPSQPDTLLGKFSKAVIDKVLAIGLIALCLLLSYILWQLYVRIPNILALNGTVLLMYKVMGPVWVYSKMWWISGWILYMMSFIWAHPYISACVIVGMFVVGIVRWVMRFFAAQNRAEEEENFKTTILNLNARLRRMEERQEEILNLTSRLQGMEERQEEILKLLRDSMNEEEERKKVNVVQ